MTAPSFRAAGSVASDGGGGPRFRSAGNSASGTGNVTPSVPSGTTTNDILLLVVQSSNETISAPSGYTAVTNCAQGTGTAATAGSVGINVFWKRAGASESAPTVADTGNHTIAQLFAFSGCVTTGNPWDVTAGGVETTANGNPSAISVTTTVDNTVVFHVFGHAVDSNASQAFGTSGGLDSATPATASTATDISTNSGTGGGFICNFAAQTTAGTTASGSFGILAGSSKWAKCTIVLKGAGGTITPGLPTGHVADDILLLYVATAATIVSAPSGYTELSNSPATGNDQQATRGLHPTVRVHVFYKRDNGTESAPSIPTNYGTTLAVILAFSGCKTSGSPIDTDARTNDSTSSVSCPAITTSQNDVLVVNAVAFDGNGSALSFSGWTNANLASVTEAVDSQQSTNEGLGIAYGVKSSAGATGNTTATGASASWKGLHTLGLLPVASGAATASASGSTNVSAVGASTATASFSAAGIVASNVTGASTAVATASSSGVGAATSTGVAQARITGSSTGLGTVSGIGSGTATATAASNGLGAGNGIGSSTSAATGSSIGAGSVSGTGVGNATATVSSSGSASVSGTGSSTAVSTGSSSGTGAVNGTIFGTAAAAGSVSGTGAASGFGSSRAASTGSSNGSSGVGGTIFGLSISVGLSSSVGTTNGTGASVAAANGAAAGAANSNVVGASTAAASSLTSGTGLATAQGAAEHKRIAVTVGIGNATGIGTAIFSAIGIASGAAAVAGIRPPTTFGVYYFSETVDLGEIYTSRLTAEMTVLGSVRNDFFDGYDLFDGTELFENEADPSSCTATLQLRLTLDDPSGSPAWTDWLNFIIGDYTAWGYEFRLLLQTFNPNVTPVVSGLSITVDMPDRIVEGKSLISGTTDYNVVFTGSFKAEPGISVTPHDMATGDYYAVVNKLASGFTVRFFNSGGTRVSRKFDYTAKGYGRVIAV